MTYPTISPELTLDFANSRQLDPRITFSRASSATYIHPDTGLITTAPDGVARIEKEGLLIEESRTNVFLHSTDFSSSWAPQSATKTTNSAAGPDGTITACKLTPSAVLGSAYMGQTQNVAISSYSVFAKADGYDYARVYTSRGWAHFNLATGVVVQEAPLGVGSIEPLPNGWYRLKVEDVAQGTPTNYRLHSFDNATGANFVGDGTSGTLFWGAQLEDAGFSTSYIPTSGSTATRSADVVSIAGTNFSSWYNQSEGTTYSETRNVPFGGGLWYYGPSGAPRWWTRNERADGVRTQAYDGSGGSGVVDIVVAGSGSGNIIPSLKHIVTIDNVAQEHAGSANGSAVVTGSWDSTNGVSTVQLGRRSDLGGNSGYLNGQISRLTYYPTRLPDTTLQTLTL